MMMPARARVPILPIQHFISITANQLVALLPDEHCSAAEEPKVRRLSAGGRWIRTIGTPDREAVLFAFAGWTFGACDKAWFALDSPLEGDGFELPVPRQRRHPSPTAG